MYESITGIEFQGAAFEQKTKMTFFPAGKENTKSRMCLIYGENGSGKSTVSRAVSKIQGQEYSQIAMANYIDKEDNEVILSEEDKKHIFVFNEDYIEKNVRVKEDGLATIVLFGNQGDLDDKIKLVNTDLETVKRDKKREDEILKKYTDITSMLSPDYYIGKIKDALKGDDHWAGRERKITNGRQNASVSDTTYKNIINSKPNLTNEEIKKQYDDAIKLLNLAVDDSKKINTYVQTDVVLKSTEDEILALLSIRLEKPKLTEREQYLMTLIEQGETLQLDEMKIKFSEKSVTQCPYCLQPVTKEYKDSLVSSIETVLSKIVDEHRDALSQSILSEVNIDLLPFQELDKSLLEKCRLAIDGMNEVIAKCNKYIKQKSESIYTPITDVEFGLAEKRTTLCEALKALDADRIRYNNQFSKVKTTKKLLRTLNNQLAYYDIIDLYKSYLKQLDEKNHEKEKLETLAIREDNKKTEYENLLQEKKSIKIAVDVINEGLQYVFFSKDRLRIGVKNNVYSLTTNGKTIRPSDVSAGERNIIALCYFFVDIMSNLSSGTAYEQECLLLIDDPVSSFDLENRIGILSFLKAQLLKLFCGNSNSKAVIMTHDLPTFYDVGKIFGEIKEAATDKFGKSQTNYALRELTKRTLIEFEERKRHEYTELISTVYNYAASVSDEYDMVIGNIMRRTLEAFSTFEYKQGIDKISCDETILDSLGEKTYYDYFQNLMYRLLLNGESHMEERVKSLTDATFASNVALEEKEHIAKDVLCFMALLNRNHVKAHLRDIPKAMTNIDSWCEQILQDNS